MSVIKAILDLCLSILQININLFGFSVNLLSVFIWGLAIYVVIWLLFGIFK